MAMENKSQGKGKGDFARTVKLEVGATVSGYVTGFETHSKHPGTKYIVLQQENGEKIQVSAKGNLRYRLKDGDIALGQLTVITRNPDRKKKDGEMVSDFYFAQDAEKTIEVASELDEAGITSDVTDAKPVSSIKERAAKLQVKS